MPISEGLRTGLNQIRETMIQNNVLYSKEIPEILPTTDIGSFASPLLDRPSLLNEFMSVLVQRIAYTQITSKLFKNKLRVLEGSNLPLGAIGQEIFINPAQGRQFNVNDFAGLLAKYEADVKVQYHQLNSDLQYPVTITRAKLKNAFVSWTDLEDFITAITNSLYNGAYIDQYNLTKGLVACAYQSGQVVTEVVNDIDSEANANAFLTRARQVYLAMQEPSAEFNAWRQVGGYGRDVMTWTNPEDIVFLIRNDIGAYLDVNVLAQAFNIDRKLLLGNVIYVNNFNQYDSAGNLIYDGSKIIGMIADKNWFKIKEQDIQMDEFYNANNRTWQMYLNIVKMYNYSLFANAIVFATEAPTVTIKTLDFKAPEGITISGVGETEGLDITVTPGSANTPEIEYSSDNEDVFTVEASSTNNRHSTVRAVGEGTATLTATAGSVTATVKVTVTE